MRIQYVRTTNAKYDNGFRVPQFMFINSDRHLYTHTRARALTATMVNGYIQPFFDCVSDLRRCDLISTVLFTKQLPIQSLSISYINFFLFAFCDRSHF